MSHETRSDETCLFDSSLADRFGSDCIERVVGSVRLVLAKPAAARQRSICRFLRGCEHWHGGGRLRNYSPDYRWWRHLDPTDGWNDDHWSPWRVVRGREHRHGGGLLRDDSPDHGWRCQMEPTDERNDGSPLWRVLCGREHWHGRGRQRDDSPDHGRGCHLDAADEPDDGYSLWRVVRGREYLHGRGRDAAGPVNSPDDGWGLHLDAADGRGAWFWFPWRVVCGREYLHGGGRLRDDSPDNDRRPLIVERQAKHDTISATATPKGGAAERSIAALNQRSAGLHSINQRCRGKNI